MHSGMSGPDAALQVLPSQR